MAQALGEDLVQSSELQDDSSSLGSDSELSGPGPYRQADRYGFIGGSSAEPGPGHPPADLIRQREMKWVEMTSHWEKTMSRRYKKVKMQCRKGIPSALRARCWPLLCGAQVCQKNSPGTYQELAEAPGDPQWMETIGRDLHRQFPLHEMFVSPQGHGRGSCRFSRPTPCIDRSRAIARPRALWRLCCSCTCLRRYTAWPCQSGTCSGRSGSSWPSCPSQHLSHYLGHRPAFLGPRPSSRPSSWQGHEGVPGLRYLESWCSPQRRPRHHDANPRLVARLSMGS
uniref:TBC1 domain family member 10C n=1 Tax=Urocitellus parryii TaxID=9999 RepID=A0A8D2H9B4_UROPR